MIDDIRNTLMLLQYSIERVDEINKQLAEMRWQYEKARITNEPIIGQGDNGQTMKITSEVIKAHIEQVEERRNDAERILKYFMQTNDIDDARHRFVDLLTAYNYLDALTDERRAIVIGGSNADTYGTAETDLERLQKQIDAATETLNDIYKDINIPPISDIVLR